MSGCEFVGLIRVDRGPIDPSIDPFLTTGIADQQTARLWRERSFAVAERPATRRSASPTLCQLPSGDILISDVRLDERADLIRTLGVDSAKQPDDATLLAHAAALWGDDAPRLLYGDFAFARWDENRQRLFLARDALGARTLYYHAGPDWIAFATTLRALIALPMVPRELDELALVDALTMAPDEHERTVYRGIARVPPGGVVVIERGTVSVRRYWTGESIPRVRLALDGDYVDAARDLLDRAVASRLPDRGVIAAMLSGGYDSTGVVAIAARLLGDRPMTAFTRLPGAPHPYRATDEGPLARAAVEAFPAVEWRGIDALVHSDRDAHPERWAQVTALPNFATFNSGWFEPLFGAVDAIDASVLLVGQMGNATLSWDGRPPFAGQVRRGRLIAAGRGVLKAARVQQRSLADVVRNQLLSPLLPRSVIARRALRQDGAMPWLRYAPLSSDLLNSLDYRRHAEATGHDLPLRGTGMRQIDLRMDTIHRQHLRDMHSALRFSHGYERHDPTADRRLAEFTLGIPDEQYFGDGRGRWLARRVLADRLPAALLAQPRRAIQCPEWFHIATQERDDMAATIERIAQSPLASRILDVPRLKRLINDWPADADAARQRQNDLFMLKRGIDAGAYLRWFEGTIA
jgi:asparagine synthase (glutamine-hydrolysing)